ncbi:MAG: APC family permease [Actinobacteria bacterium]|nr:APC family permease [Actinomycetota bacterium]
MQRIVLVLKRVLVGKPVSSYAELEHRVSKKVALAVFSSDALSSSAYATDVMLVVLAAAGAGALWRSVPIAFGVVFVLSVVIISYRIAIRAYPNGGGGYAVASDNLGLKTGVLVASALLIDYVLTVAVSVAAAVKALGAALPAVGENRVGVAVGVVILITVANLRGVKEAGSFFAFPTYGFLLSMGVMILIGLTRVFTGTHTPLPPPQIEAEQALTMFLILKAFAGGSTALTGVEAMANAVPAFRPPEAKNAAQTLAVLGVLLAFLFIGVTFLANAYQVDPVAAELHGKTVPSQIAGAVFGVASPMFYVIQFFTALILFLAANTAYAGFPSLASVLARDRILPRVLQNRGDKLAYSNGIVILAALACLALILYEADELKLINLYVIGVFTDFTLSQTGLVKRWFRLKTPGWRRFALLNAIGAVTTFVVLIIQATTKFTAGAWQVIILIPLLAFLLYRVNRHYVRVQDELKIVEASPRFEANKVIVLVSPLMGATVKAYSFARSIGPKVMRVVAFRVPERRLQRIRTRWTEIGIKNPIEATGYRLRDLVDYIRGLDPQPDDPVTLVIPDPQHPNPLVQLSQGRNLLRIKGAFLAEPNVVVVSIPFRQDLEPEPEQIRAPRRLSVIVLVASVHRATVRALRYAQSLNPSELKAVSIVTNPEEAPELIRRWEELDLEVPLEVVDSPYRSIIPPLLKEIRSMGPSQQDAVAVVIPEFIVSHWWEQLLHGQTALMIKTTLLFEPNVVVIDVPFPLKAGRTREDSLDQ